MTLKEFVKSLSVYGFLPVFTKFAGLLLVPIYVRVLSQYDYGIAELILSIVGFVTYLINLEFYGAIGRFYFDRGTHAERQNLISTGLYMTLISALFVASVCLAFQGRLHDLLFKQGQYHVELRMGLLWAVISAVSTYLSILPRYEKKGRLYVLYNIISVSVKLLSTILFVVVLRLGIRGILYGHIAGAACSSILYAYFSRKYLVLYFTTQEARRIAKFALPLVPGVFMVGIYQPTMRFLVSRVYNVETLALLSFAFRMVNIMTIVETGIRLSWRPMLYENIRRASFGPEYVRISRFAGSMLLLIGIVISCLSKELVTLLGTSKYLEASKLIGFLAIGNVIINLDSLRGFGYELAKKTHYITLIEIIARGLGLLFLWLLAFQIGLAGIGLAFIIPSLLSYGLKVNYTKRIINLSSINLAEAMLWLIAAMSIVFAWLDMHILVRVGLLALAIPIALPWQGIIRGKKKYSRSGHYYENR